MLNRLESRGFCVENAPVFRIRQIPIDADCLQNADIICITSQNGAHSLIEAPNIPRNKPILAVGEGSAAPLECAGFNNILVANGTGASLVDLIRNTFPKSHGSFLHLSGEHVSLDIAQALKQRGYTASRVIGYRANAIGSFSVSTKQLIASGKAKAVVFLSRRTASEFLKNVRRAGLASQVRRAEAFVMSPNIAEIMDQNRWRKARVSSAPSAEAVIASLEKHASRLGLKA